MQKASGTTVLSFVNSSVIMSITTETKAYGFHAGKGIRMTIREEIEQLKKEKNAVILAHYYVRPEVQEIADYFVYGRKCESAESSEDGSYAGCKSGLCDGAYGR